MPNVEEVKVHLATSVDQTQRAMTGIRGVLDQVDEALARLRLTALGTAHPSLIDAINRLEQARARLDEAHVLADGAIDSANTYRMLA